MESLRIRIPQRYQSGIAKLVSLQEYAIEELLSALSELPSTFDLDQLKSQITLRLSSIPISDLDEVLEALAAMHFLYLESEASLEFFVDQICRAMDISGNEKLKLDTKTREDFQKRLVNLLNGKFLAIAAKASHILHEHERTFGRTHITTDIRSIFGSNVGSPPVAAIIVHMLKLHYIQDREHKDFFLALDTSDISILIDALKRAQEEAQTLKSTLTAANIHYIDAK